MSEIKTERITCHKCGKLADCTITLSHKDGITINGGCLPAPV
jgi:hypothetical protein